MYDQIEFQNGFKHQLSNRKTGKLLTNEDGRKLIADGKAEDAAMFYVKRENPWHMLGKPVDECLTAKDALVAAGLDFEVKKNVLYDADGRPFTKENGCEKFYIYRTDTMTHLGTVGNDYTEIQNEDGFAILDHIIGNNAAKFDTAGALYGGSKVWMSAELQKELKVAGDEIKMYFACVTTHDGTGKLILAITPIRTVCQNTVNLALGQVGMSKRPGLSKDGRTFAISHTKNYEQRVDEAQRAFGFVTEYAEKFESVATKLAKAKRSEKQFEELMIKLIGDTPKDDASKKTATLYERKRQELFDCLHASDLNNVSNTAWGHYNAVADWHDHYGDLRGDNKDANALLRTFQKTDAKDIALATLLDDLKITA